MSKHLPIQLRNHDIKSLTRIFLKDWIASIVSQLSALIGIYGLCVDGYLALRLVKGEQFVLVAFLDNAAHFLFAGSIICFFLAWLFPHRLIWALYNLPGVIAFVIWYAPLFLPKMAQPVATTFTTATYNITGRTNLEQKVAVIQEMDVDLLGIQETATRTLAEDLSDLYPYHQGYTELEVYSRFPLSEAVVVETPTFSVKPVVMKMTADIDGTVVSVYVAHPERPTTVLWPPAYDGALRHQAIQTLVQSLGDDPNPVLLLCDCNMSDQTGDYNQLTHVLADSWREVGFGLGLTSPGNGRLWPFPLLRSDYIWHSSQIVAQSINVWYDTGSSDHYPVKATLGLK